MFRQQERVANHFTMDRASIRGAVGWVEGRRGAPEPNPSAEPAATTDSMGFAPLNPSYGRELYRLIGKSYAVVPTPGIEKCHHSFA